MMDGVSTAPDDAHAATPRRATGRARRWLEAVLVLAVLSVATFGAWRLVDTKPSTKRKPQPREATLVEVVEATSVRRKVAIEASGTVVGAHAVEVRPEVTGRVVALGDGLVPGTIVKRGALIARLDGRDFHLAVARAKSALARAEAALSIERGNQRIARAELEQYEKEHPGRAGGAKENALALRRPQLDSALADVADAKAALAQAQLDASRTTITAPFDAVVTERAVTVGMNVTAATVLAHLVGIDAWWVEAAVPKDQLRWLHPSDTRVRVLDDAAWGPNASRDATLLRIGAEVIDGGRMAKVVVAVDDPLGLEAKAAPKMLLGSWVRVVLEGEEVDSVELDRHLLRDGDTVWVMDAEGKLDVRSVVVGARSRDAVFVVSGLEAGERVVKSALKPVPGMQLVARGETDSEARRR